MFEIAKKTRSESPAGGSLLKKIKKSVLGEKYQLSLVLAGNVLTKKLNQKFRGKNRPTNVLSFPLSKDSGEIFLNIPYIKKETEKYQTNFQNLFLYLFLHGLIHLKGYEHGKSMDRQEKFWAKKFNIKIPY